MIPWISEITSINFDVDTTVNLSFNSNNLPNENGVCVCLVDKFWYSNSGSLEGMKQNSTRFAIKKIIDQMPHDGGRLVFYMHFSGLIHI